MATMPVSATESDIIAQDTIGFLIESSKAQQAQQDNFRKAEGITYEITQAYKDVADSAALVSRTNNLAELTAQQYRQRAANAAGLSATAGVDELTNTIARINAAKEKTRAAAAEVERKTTTTAWDNPIEWLANHFTLPASEARLTAAEKELEFEQKNLLQINQTMSVAEATGKRISESVTAASVDAAATVVASEAQIKARAAQLDGLKYNNEGLKLAVSGPKERLDAWYNLQNADQRAQQFALSKKNFELQTEEFDWRKQVRTAEQEAKDQGKQIDDVLANKIGIGYATLGMPVPSPLEIKSQVALFKTGASKDLMRVYEIGNRTIATGLPMIGATPAESIRNLDDLPNNVAPARMEVLGMLKQIRDQVLASPKIDKKDGKAVDAEINKLTEQTIGGMLASITAGSGNVFDIGDLGGFIEWKDGTKGIPDMHAHPLSQKLLIPAIRAGQPLSDPKIVLGLVSDAVQKGTITSNDAVDGLSFLYKKANLINQQALNLKGLGIVLPMDGAVYNAKIGMFGKTLDLTNPTAIGQYLATDLAKRVYNSSPRQLMTPEEIEANYQRGY